MLLSIVIILLICACAFACNYEKDVTDDDFALYGEDSDTDWTRFNLNECDESDEEEWPVPKNCAEYAKEDCSKFSSPRSQEITPRTAHDTPNKNADQKFYF